VNQDLDNENANVGVTNSNDELLPSVEEFMALVDDEEKVTAHNLSGYSVYHKYNKSC